MVYVEYGKLLSEKSFTNQLFKMGYGNSVNAGIDYSKVLEEEESPNKMIVVAFIDKLQSPFQIDSKFDYGNL